MDSAQPDNAIRMCQIGGWSPPNRPEKGGSTENVTRIGLDLPKNLYELYGVEAHHREVLSKQVRRAR
jgi:hypothetical protein